MKRMVLLLGLVGCADVPQPFELDHARVMAVRMEPPALAPDAVGRIDVLVTDAERGPRLADPTAFVVTAPAGIEVTQAATGWEVQSPSAEELAAVRASLGLAADAAITNVLQKIRFVHQRDQKCRVTVHEFAESQSGSLDDDAAMCVHACVARAAAR